ncbi:MAG: efflux RND transporter permease subunit [Pseudomonadales bacterium]|nr:efflux RND transporter permease subunit [Pseudomonadales bacterium]
MWLSDTSVTRPVFASVVSLLVVAFGVLSFNALPVREYPDINPPVVSISTNYPGAAADVIESRVTRLLEDQISGIEGIKTIRSSSRDETSDINIEFELQRNVDEAANDVRDRVARVLDRLPDEADPPVVAKQDTDARPVMYMSLSSDRMDMMALYDYADRYLVDRFSVLPGVAAAGINGGSRPSMRIALDRMALAARQLTVSDIEAALRRENLELPAGRLESADREFRIRLARGYGTPEDFRQLVVGRGENGHLVRLGEVAEVALGPRNKREAFRANQRTTVGIAIIKQSTANTLETLEAVKAEIARINTTLPEHMQFIASSDDSIFIREAIDSVYETIAITTLLVSLVILLFLGSLRAMIVPALTIPICLVGACIFLAAFGFSLNLITLLAMVLSIGLVVDDAIVVLENIHRRIDAGEPPLLAGFNGARQVGFAVIATTLVLVAVFTPIIFLRDNMGVLFGELALTIAAAVGISSVIALSLTPMLSARLLKPHTTGRSLSAVGDRLFRRLETVYRRLLRGLLRWPWLAAVITVATLAGLGALYRVLPAEYAPAEDQGMFMARVQALEGTSAPRMVEIMSRVEAPVMAMVDQGIASRVLTRIPGFGSSTPNAAMIVVSMAPWSERDVTTAEAAARASAAWQGIPSVRAFAFARSGLSRGGGDRPVQFVVGGPDYPTLAVWRDQMLAAIEQNPGIVRPDVDLKETQPQMLVRIDRQRAASLGVSTQTIGRSLATMLSEQRVTTFLRDGEEYDVVLEAREDQRASASDLQNLYVRSDTSGRLIPLANLVRVDSRAGAASLERYNRIRAITISASLAPDYSLGQALDFLEATARELLPEDAQLDYKGESLEYRESSGTLAFTFSLAMLIVFLVLAAQFESFSQPLVILLTVPLALAGAFLALFLSGDSLNIFSQIGVIMLIGIAAKNGVLIVEFINQQRDAGLAFSDAIVEGATLRLRPVLMTSLATIMGAVPLMLASGAGAESRQVLGIVIFGGVSVATLFTLFVVPGFYRLLALRSTSPEAGRARLEALQEATPTEGDTPRP